MDRLQARMQQLFVLKNGQPEAMGWGPRLRRRYRHFSPDDYYEAIVDGLVESATEWIDVGGGSAIFPGNPKLARLLADRCRRLVAVDPSSNVNSNPFAHERCQATLEEYPTGRRFTLATARMVVEHVVRPELFAAKLGELIQPGGRAVIYTVNRWAPMTILSAWTPPAVHYAAARFLWNAHEKDVFPVIYRMNTRQRLRGLFHATGFREVQFFRLDDCRTLAGWRATLTAELLLWKALRAVGAGYPESCLMGVYERL